jgi:chromosome segregation ATPase
MAILDLKRQLSEQSMQTKKGEFKVSSLNDKLEKLELKNKDLKDQLEEIEKEKLSTNNKLMNQKFGKDEMARKLIDAEEKLGRRNNELAELKQRLDDHTKSNQMTEASLHSRISDLQEEL